MRINRFRRREVITLVGGAAAVWPLAAGAQQTAMPVIGYIDAGSPEPAAHLVSAFRGGLGETGFVDGRNVAIEFRWAHNNNERLADLAADLVRRRVAVIVAPQSTAAVMEAKAATRTRPEENPPMTDEALDELKTPRAVPYRGGPFLCILPLAISCLPAAVEETQIRLFPLSLEKSGGVVGRYLYSSNRSGRECSNS